MRKNKGILILFLLFFLISCKGKNNDSKQLDQEHNESIQTPDEVSFSTTTGCINITKKLNVRNAPSVKGKIIRQVSFGDYFNILEERGSKTINDGVFDLWYKISADKEEWLNALYLREFPFFISSDERRAHLYRHDSDEELYRKLTMKIEGYREINGRKELMVEVDSLDRIPFAYSFTPVKFRRYVELQEEYSFSPEQEAFEKYSPHIQSEYKVTLLDSMFEILRNYSLEIQEIQKMYPVTDDIEYEEFRILNTWSETITINSSKIVLPGIRVGSKEDDVFVQFGKDFTSLSKGYSEQITYSLSYWFGDSYYPFLIKFILIDGKVEKIIHSCKFTK